MLFGVWLESDGTMVGFEPVAWFFTEDEAREYAERARAGHHRFDPGSLLASYNGYAVHDLRDVQRVLVP